MNRKELVATALEDRFLYEFEKTSKVTNNAKWRQDKNNPQLYTLQITRQDYAFQNQNYATRNDIRRINFTC